MDNRDYYQEKKPELDEYLRNNEASPEERKCAQLWVKDGHWISENDHESEAWFYEGMDFLTASREAQYNDPEFTESYYDPATQEYIRKMKPTPSELRELRVYIHDGGRFVDEFIAAGNYMDYITFIRSRDEVMAEMFESCFEKWIIKYGAEFITCRNQECEFVRFLESKEDYRKSLESKGPSMEELLSLPADTLPFCEDQSI